MSPIVAPGDRVTSGQQVSWADLRGCTGSDQMSDWVSRGLSSMDQAVTVPAAYYLKVRAFKWTLSPEKTWASQLTRQGHGVGGEAAPEPLQR